MRSKSFLLHKYNKNNYIRAITFDSRRHLTSYLRDNGCKFNSDLLGKIGDGLLILKGKKDVYFEIEELFC